MKTENMQFSDKCQNIGTGTLCTPVRCAHFFKRLSLKPLQNVYSRHEDNSTIFFFTNNKTREVR
jgi:hypothetical protein